MLQEEQGKRNSWSVFFIAVYQTFLSPYFGGNCRFYPSCSHYARSAYEQFNWFQATFMSVKRLLKCHPFGSSGYDPLPPKEVK